MNDIEKRVKVIEVLYALVYLKRNLFLRYNDTTKVVVLDRRQRIFKIFKVGFLISLT